ncbi:MAG TPA: outer membrane protein assembly factor BamA [Verrucomicrobiae bacterium]
MNSLFRFCGVLLLLVTLPVAHAQLAGPKVLRVEVKHVGPPSASDQLLQANIRVKAGDVYRPASVDDDVRSLYATGQFYNVRVTEDRTDDGVVLTYVVQGNPLLTDLKFQGNKKFSDAKLKKTISSKAGSPLSERKLFTDSQEIQKLYQKKGYPNTTVKYVLAIDEAAGRGSATFEITESRKVKIEHIEFAGATAFKQSKLRKVLKKTREHWMFSWLTGNGFFKDEEFEDDQELLRSFYREKGYIDFEIKDVKFEHPTPKTMSIRFEVFEGKPYQLGDVSFRFVDNSGAPAGTSMLPTNAVQPGFKRETKPPTGVDRRAWYDAQHFNRAFKMKAGDTFTPVGLSNNAVAIENFYGARGHIDVTPGTGNLRTRRVPNTERNTMDLEYSINEGQKSYIEKIEIRGNTKTKDKVIRRELAVSPGETFDMVRVKLSEARLKGLQYFEKVELKADPTEIPSRRNLLVAVEEKTTGNIGVGAGFSSIDAVVGYVEYSQGNFDLMKPPLFTGGGQKFRLRVQLGTERQDYIMSFIEPWFLGRKLALGVDLYHRNLSYQSYGGLYDEMRSGASVSLRRTLWNDFAIGGISYTIENVGIDLDPYLHPARFIEDDIPGNNTLPGRFDEANAPSALFAEAGHSLVSRFGVSLAYDTRNSTFLPNRGQRTELSAEAAGPWPGDKNYWKTEMRTAWYFKGLFTGHVLEVIGRGGLADSYGDTDVVPFYDRYYLGGLYSLRGFKYREISPREPGFDEPIGGNTFWFGSVEYSIPIIEKLRFALFYDIGNVGSDLFDWNFKDYSDNWGFGLRLNLPIGPLRLDYGIPLNYDKRYSGGDGRFQFGVGYSREF